MMSLSVQLNLERQVQLNDLHYLVLDKARPTEMRQAECRHSVHEHKELNFWVLAGSYNFVISVEGAKQKVKKLYKKKVILKSVMH